MQKNTTRKAKSNTGKANSNRKASSNESFCNVFDSCCDCIRDYYNGVPCNILCYRDKTWLTSNEKNINLPFNNLEELNKKDEEKDSSSFD